MPNWKSYESSVRLLSAIVAAHPDLKLNYGEIGRFYGDDTGYKAVWGRMKQINKCAKSLVAAIDAGQDPITVKLEDTIAAKAEGKEIAVRFGGDCTKSALENRFRRIKSDAVLINRAIADGIDPIEINVGDTDGQTASKSRVGQEIARCYGSEATPSAIKNIYGRYIRPDVKAIGKMLEAGGDPMDVNLSWETTRGTGIAQHFGSGVTPKALQHIFNNKVHPDVRNLRAVVSAGQDAKGVVLSWTGGSSGNEIAKAYGSECTKLGLQTHWTRDINPNVKLITECLKKGNDPKHVVLIEGVRHNCAGKQIARCYGGTLNGKALHMHFTRNIRPGASLILEALAQGQDPEQTVTFGTVEKGGKDLAKCMGSDTTAGSLQVHFSRCVRKDAAKILDCINSGGDPKDLKFTSEAGGTKSQNDISNYFGSDSTGGGIGFQFRQLKINAKRQRDCFDAGGDPKDLNIGQAIARLLNDDTTTSALEHRFRPIKKDGAAMKAAIANSYGEGISGNGTAGGSAKSTPRKRASPKKKATMKESDSGDDDEENFEDTPSKKSKTGLHKTVGGRVTKAGRAARPNPGAFAEQDDDEEEILKNEPEDDDGAAYYSGNGGDYSNGYSQSFSTSNGNGNGNAGGAYHDGPEYYDAEEI